ncbi:hypothetical protein DEO72_LG1g2227 [Vigna unguiculata]|uniref:Uncharacterized protein n=1 Tax=Vigna unguiculata TaxID=3917 RepID=A0A4D6KVU3_VIGUN|nr:hypothetical protein DEO72_LG1g2227 [Vigna unguiculata]
MEVEVMMDVDGGRVLVSMGADRGKVLVSRVSESGVEGSRISERSGGFDNGSTKFPFSWTSNPSRYKDMGMEELSASDKEVVGMLLKFVDKLPTKGLVRVYNSVHPIIDIEGHMAQSGKKNLALFQTLRKEMAAKAKAVGKADVPNLQESVVEVHVHGGTKRKDELLPRPGKGKDVKKIRATLLGTASGAGSASGGKGPEAELIELPEISNNGRVWE